MHRFLGHFSTAAGKSVLARFAMAGMAVAVIGLGALSLWTSVVAENETGDLSRAAVQVSGHLRVVQALGQIDKQSDLVEEGFDPAIVAKIRQAQHELERGLARMDHGDFAPDRVLARRSRPAVARARVATDAYIAAVRTGESRLLARAEADMEAILDTIQRDFNDLAADPSRLLSAKLEGASHREELTRAIAIVLVPFGLVLLLVCAWVLASVRRANEATLRFSRDLHATDARTDQLTAVGNRRRLTEDLERRLAAGEEFALALADLNGFKRYNDSFGHPAGDALLQRLAARLTAACEGRAAAYRPGGDEFCVMTDGPMALDELTSLVRDALFEEGDGFSISSACGTAALPAEAGTASDALRVADMRMYEVKESRRAMADGSIEPLLLKMLDEHHPGLGSHVHEVADLAGRCAAALEASPAEIEDIRRAAQLHDIGKIAIPSAVLDKPSALDPDEWAFIRRHTIIGERILSAAPAMGTVATLVRASHERWDGGGYPDGTAGTDIPFGARVVAVADAFCAMTEDRPYRAALTVPAALQELARCAGSQFDPAVVDAFVRAHATAGSSSPRIAAVA